MPKAAIQIVFILLLAIQVTAAPDTALLVKTLGVAEGLPQSFISGLIQDKQGFIWIGTRDGLARYDGRKFKVFNHIPGDTATLAANIISNLYYDSRGRLWILYESGETDLLNTATESLLHLTSQPVFRPALNALKGHVIIVRSFAEDAKGNIWLPGKEGGVFIFNIEQNWLSYFSDSALGLKGNPVVGLANDGNGILLVTDTALVSMDAQRRILHSTPYQFDTPHLYSKRRKWKDAYPVIRKNGEIVILDEQRLIIYQPRLQTFKTFPLPERKVYLGPNIMQDDKGNVFFDFKGIIYRLSADNILTVWRCATGRFPESQCMLTDRSGILWVGGNGTGVQLYDQRLTHFRGQAYQAGFVKDMLKNMAVSEAEINTGFILDLDPYLFRWAKDNNGMFWFTKSGSDSFNGTICTLSGNQLSEAKWKVERNGTGISKLRNINALACSRSGKLWGVDYYFRLIYLDKAAHKAIPLPTPVNANGANSMVIDGETTFWISTTAQGLFRYDRASTQVQQYASGTNGGGFLSSQTSMLLQDPSDTGKLWIGTLGSGLLHFDKKTGSCKAYTTSNGLPNNTVYAVLPDATGRLWGSTNKGIFCLDPKTGTIYSFTAKDGLVGDEFNRFHFITLQDGQIAFGGVDGYILFNPLSVAEDNFDPEVAITDISINNVPADFGNPGSPLPQAINSLTSIELPYQSNFLTFEFAALEYNVPEKLQYRYILEGVNPKWVAAGHNNTAVYTNLPPGNYTLTINATNTAGKWGTRVKRLTIIIRPPFWKTGWFILLCCLAAAGLLYWFIYSRLSAIRQKQRQQLQFERKAMELEAQALRAQMNPHFIFNCLNSIKSLIQEDKKGEAVIYLTTFSKLIRNQLSNAQKEVSLHDELETCKLYVRLEGLRFGNKITSTFTVADGIDTHIIMVPPLIIQPFIENAIWHGILPLDNGGQVTVAVMQEPGLIKCSIDDNGIGREQSGLNKSKTSPTHHSKGMQLIEERLDLHGQIHNRGGWMEIEDKKDGKGDALGTSVTLYFKTDL